MAMEEEKRLKEALEGSAPWRKWGPYVSDRQWGTVREDYSANGDAWASFSHDEARSRTYRWGEDGIAGICDEKQRICFALCFWNGKDPILKERLFGLTGHEGNHGEDVKEYSFPLDNVPSHAYMKYLYKYPQQAYPYADLVQENQRRTRLDFEYELLDTGVFGENRYFDVVIEYAKADPEDILIQISATNRGPEVALLHLLPTLWFRNSWSWAPNHPKPLLSLSQNEFVTASHPFLDETYTLYAEPPKEWLFTENETNKQRLFGTANDSPYVKDGIHEYIVQGKQNAVNPEKKGTKMAVSYLLHISPGETKQVRLRLTKATSLQDPLGKNFSHIVALRKKEADAFYKHIASPNLSDEMMKVQRQAFAGMLWNKQFYHYNVARWLRGDPLQVAPPEERNRGRNAKWKWLDASDIFSMPDKWEYPWFAAWDLAFHAVIFAEIDPDFAKNQLLLLTKEWYMFPNGQIPAYEWDFGDVNPPVQAWAAFCIYQTEKEKYGRKDLVFLERMFQKLVLNFTWWVNREDKGDRNIFEGGFLGLDNIFAFDRTKEVPKGAVLYQVDATSWMGMYCLNLLQIALELSLENPVYEDMATKFFEHFVAIADVINSLEGRGLWDEKEGYYHGFMTFSTGKQMSFGAVTMVGAMPLFATLVQEWKDTAPNFEKHFQWLLTHRPHLTQQSIDINKGSGKVLLSFVPPEKMVRILEKVLDEAQLLSPFGIRSLSKKLEAEPMVFHIEDKVYTLNYEPAESTNNLFGGNSNWRGPIWFPLNYLLIQSLRTYDSYLGEGFTIEYPQNTGRQATLQEVAMDLSRRLIQIFLPDEKGYRPLYGGMEKFQKDPHWKDHILFHEYFHADNGAGLGASNQTGWTGLVALLIQQYGQDLQKKK